MQVIFTNGTQSVELKYVRSVEWQADFSEETLVDNQTRVGKRTRTLTVNGFINKGIVDKNILAQQQLESDLIAVGTGTLEYGGGHDIDDIRFLGVEFSEFRGNPICQFKIKFKTEELSIHAHYPTQIGDLILAPTYGYEHPSVKTSIAVQGPDEQLVGTARRTITLNGTIVASTREEINEKQQAIIDEIEGNDTVDLSFSADSGSYIATISARPRKVDFSAPRLRGDQTARDYTLEFATHDDYSKEPYVLGESAVTIGGITINVVEGFDHDKEFEYSNTSQYSTVNETVTVSGKKFFTDYDDYSTFRDLFNSIDYNTYFYTSDTANVLELTDITIGKFDRDGNFVDTTKRYAASVTLTFKWQKSIQQTNYSALTTYFGVSFYKVPSVTFNSQVDANGNVTSRSISLNGEVKGTADITAFKALVGTMVSFEAPYTNLYVSSANISSVDTFNDSGIQVKVYKVSLTAAQLDTAGQAVSFIRSLFRLSRAGGGGGTSYNADTIQLENVTNYSKSISNRWNITFQQFTVTSITISISGEVFDPDNGSGKPTSPNKIIAILDKIDALLTAQKSNQQNTANTMIAGELLPTNASISYFLNSFNVGNWQPAIAPETLQGSNGAKGARYWRQTVSLNATAVFDLTGSANSEPDSVETRSYDVDLETPRTTQLQVAGFGTVFKRIGTNPEKATVVHQKQFRNARVYVPNDYGFGNAQPTPSEWRGLGFSVLTKEHKENRGYVNRWTVEYEATKKLGS